MRSFQRNAPAETIVEALMAGTSVPEGTARLWVHNVLTAEREGFSQRITRRLREARYYHHGQSVKAPDAVELLSSKVVLQIIHEEVTR